jgi:hypothetical protein
MDPDQLVSANTLYTDETPRTWQYTRRRYELLERGVALETVRRVRRDTYCDVATDADEKWRQDLEAFLRRSGPGAVVGLRSAARLHGLDGFVEHDAIDTLTRAPHHANTDKVHRTRTLEAADIVDVDGFPTTSKARTMFDLGRVCTPDEVEVALESALRGPDPKQPDQWDEELLADLHERTRRVAARTGGPTLRRVLRRRPEGSRPTGSFAETKFSQDVAHAGMEPFDRQIDVRILNGRGRLLHHFFPDFGDLRRLILIEINGAAARDGNAMTARDLTRMNLLQPFFRFHVITGADAIFNPRTVAQELRVLRTTEPLVTFPCVRRGCRIERTATGLDIVKM